MVDFFIGKPFCKYCRCFGFLIGCLVCAQSDSGLRCVFFSDGRLRNGQHLQVSVFPCVVFVCNFVVVVQSSRRRGNTCNGLSCHYLRVGVQIGYNNMPFCNGFGKFFVGIKQNFIVFVPAVVGVKVRCALAYRVQFHRTNKVVDCAKRLSCGVVVVLFGNVKEAVPSFQIVVGYVFYFGKPLKGTSCQIQEMRGLRNGQCRQRIPYNTVGNKTVYKAVEFRSGKLVFPIDKIFRAEFLGITCMAKE